ncbi:MAG: Ppx/GppA family phosphatase, partial [Armatimonadetes bacterium]
MTTGTGPIVPRWEWRTFGTRFGRAEVVFESLEPEGVQESDELYFLSPGGANVKIRNDLVDVKVLEEVDADGLERWMPILKAEFPLTSATVRQIVDAMGIGDITLHRETFTLDELITDLAATVQLVQVHKRRVRYSVGGCTAEVSEVTVDGRPTRTIAIESEDAAAVVDAVREVGLGSYINTNYQKGLSWVVDGAPERYAIIDVGTNSVKFHVSEWRDGQWSTTLDRAELTRLGEGLAEEGSITPDAF